MLDLAVRDVEVEPVIGAVTLVLRRTYVVKEGVVGGIEVVGMAVKAIKAIEVTKVVVVFYILVTAEIYGLEAVSEVSKVSKV